MTRLLTPAGLAALAVVASCLEDEPSGTTTSHVATVTVNNVTVSGREIYDDQRDFGRFNLRGGEHHDKNRNDEDDDGPNFLGMLDATVELYEVDANYPVAVGQCQPLTFLGTATVGADGRWSRALGSVSDPCMSDDDPENGVRIAAKTTLTFCTTQRCFSIVDPRLANAIWSDFNESASATNAPAVTPTQPTLTLPTNAFDDTDEQDKAASAFASLVDITRKFHVENNWPFHFFEFGVVNVYFPSTGGGEANGPSAIQLGNGQHQDGWTPMHEYGHILDNRMLGGLSVWIDDGKAPCPGGFCDSWDRNGQYEWASKAWKEGVADFYAHVALDNTGINGAVPGQFRIGCSIPNYDDNADPGTAIGDDPKGDLGRTIVFDCTMSNCQGSNFPTNVARALCDFFDSRNDDDPARSGSGDTTSMSLDTVFDTVHDAYHGMDEDELAREHGGFGICDMSRLHAIRTSTSAVLGVLNNNGISCNL